MADETPQSTTQETPADTLDVLEESEGGNLRTRLAQLVERFPLVVFSVFSVLALGLIVGVIFLFRGRGTPTVPELDPGAIIAARNLQLQAAKASTTLSSDTAFEQALHPLLSLAEIRHAEVPTTFLAEELLRLKQVNLALSVDVREALRQSTDRTTTFDTMLENLIAIDKQLTVTAGRIIDQEQVLRDRIETAAAQEEAATAQLNASIETTDPSISTQALGTVVAARERHAQLTSRLELLEDVRDEIPSSSLALRARIAGMRANRELLVRDLVAIDIDRAGIEILREEKAATYYDPSIDVRLSSGLQAARVTAPNTADITLPTPSVRSGGATSNAGIPMLGPIPMVTLERGSDGLPKVVMHDQ